MGKLRDYCGKVAGLLWESCVIIVGKLRDYCEKVAGLLWESCGIIVGKLRDYCGSSALCGLSGIL